MKNMRELAWWQRGVIYQIYPRSFQDTTGNGIGDLEGVIRRLDYLDELNVDAIWLNPFFPSPMVDFGYDVSDYTDIHPLFGDMATFDRLVTEAHRRDIRIIIDFVPNHSSDQHPWFVESRSQRDNPKRDWYIWRAPKPDGSPPNNWGSYFGGPAWTFDAETGQYYLHQFAPEQPELNLRNPEVREAMMDALRFWLERGVDGFRIDVIYLVFKDTELRDNPPAPNADPNRPHNDILGGQLQIYNKDQDENFEFIRDIRRLLDRYDERCGIGEVFTELPQWIRYYGEDGDGLHMPFNFRLIRLPWQAEVIRRSVAELEAALPPFAWPNYVLGNHDFPRLASRLGGETQARVAAMMLLTLRGTPTIYYGDELGLENGLIPPEQIRDPLGINLGPEQSRDGCRTPMQWHAGPGAGFSQVEPWLPVSDDYRTRNVAVQSSSPTSTLNLYRRLLALRRASPALYGGSYCPLLNVPEQCFAYVRRAGNERKLIVLNFSDTAQTLGLPKLADSPRVLLSTYLDREGAVNLFNLPMRANEGCILDLA